MRAYDVPAGRVAVAHDERRLFAFDDTCPGEGCALSEGAFDDRTDAGGVHRLRERVRRGDGRAVGRAGARPPAPVHGPRGRRMGRGLPVPGRVIVAGRRPSHAADPALGSAPHHAGGHRERPDPLRPGRRIGMPTAWFNIMPSIVQAGMQPLPPLHPGTHEPVGPADLAPLFPRRVILQEVSIEPWIDIPGGVRGHLSALAAVPAARRPAPAGAARSEHRRRFCSSTRASRRPGATSRTRRSPRPSTTRRPARSGSRPRRAPGSGARRSRWRAGSSGSTARSSW